MKSSAATADAVDSPEWLTCFFVLAIQHEVSRNMPCQFLARTVYQQEVVQPHASRVLLLLLLLY